MTDDSTRSTAGNDDFDHSALAFSQDEIQAYKRLKAAKRTGIGRRWAIFFNFLLWCALVAGGSVAAWLYQEQSAQLRYAMEALPNINQQLARLTSESEESGKTLTSRFDTAVSQIEQLEQEVRSLRNLVNKRNQQWIKDNALQIGKQQKDIGELLEDLKVLKGRSRSYDKGLQVQQNLLERTSTSELNLQQLSKSNQTLADDLNRKAEELQKITDRLKAEEAFSKATQGHRKQINRQYLQINKRLASLKESITALESAP